ncbi:UDP-glucose dehydrogenase family protein [Microbacterium galbinum]|uniref:UDP-glucose 6-dehydrogenase n=1 Tax=Microbacterium galbinum TaxID=2851646 RepID=A0ABY4IQZ2_9MICO|nr:UDP-glucose/GDP-mannose dehydrogenase family protein [Microbacterium galbinum]UPL15210.1 UDP-glucose/GDP-mannose dehydrogenase family protein [Microbacterium galbinum]
MKLSVIGCGYLGAVHAAAMASIGHEVIGFDVDHAKIERLAAGEAPFYEPGFNDLLRESLASGNLRFTTDPAALTGSTVHFIAVGTPQREDSDGADLRFVDAAVTGLLPHLAPGDLVVGKSTVPVGTAQRLADMVTPTGAMLAWNPEFLREGFAVQDTLQPDRIVYGTAIRDGAEVEILDAVYATALKGGVPRLVTDYATAELVKVAANAFLATKISFINAMSEIADATGADVTELADAIGHDVRIGRRFLNAGVGFGGGCLPKDIRAFAARGEELGHGRALRFLREVDEINLRQRTRLVELVEEALGGSVAGRRIAILGLAFKPNSDDTRDSPALDVATRLHGLGADVVSYDPEAVGTARRARPHLVFAESLEEAVAKAEVTVVVTEWDEFRELSPDAIASAVAEKKVIDGRNCLDPERWRAAGWTYRGLGRR